MRYTISVFFCLLVSSYGLKADDHAGPRLRDLLPPLRPVVPVTPPSTQPGPRAQEELLPATINFDFTEKAGTSKEKTYPCIGTKNSNYNTVLNAGYEVRFEAGGQKRKAQVEITHKWRGTLSFTFNRDNKVCSGDATYENPTGYVGSMRCPSGETYRVVIK